MSAINSVNALRSQVAPANNTTIEVKGYYSPGDGGSGIFFWDTGSYLLPDNGWDIIQINNNSTGKWRRLIEDRSLLNIRWFGPKATNAGGLLENTNDTNYINRAIGELSREFKTSVHFATTVSLASLNGFPNIDGNVISGINYDPRILVKDQTVKCREFAFKN